MPLNTKLVVRNDQDEIIGYISNYGCDNPECHAEYANGRKWHAIPRGFGVTLPNYHFNDLDRAIDALHGAALKHGTALR